MDRLTLTELAELAADLGPDPRVIGVVLELDGPAPDDEHLARLLGERLGRVPHLAVRLDRPRLRWPRWTMAERLDVRDRLDRVACAGAGTDDDLLDAVARILCRPLPPERPMWAVTTVTGLAGGRDALVVAIHHGLLDGPGALAAVAGLLDPEPGPDGPAMPQPPAPPGAPERAASSPGSSPGARTGRLPWWRSLVLGVGELAASGVAPAPATSLNRPITAGARLAVADVDLGGLRRTARAHGATVNDALLAACGSALGGLLADRGEPVRAVVVSVPVTRPAGGPAGSDVVRRNKVGVLRVAVPVPAPGAPEAEHLERVAALTRPRKRWASGESAALLAPGFVLLGLLRLYRPMVERQRLITTLLSNMRGPVGQVRIAGRGVRRIIPVAPVVGNVPVAFAALSANGRLVLTARASPEAHAELPVLRDRIERHLRALGG